MHDWNRLDPDLRRLFKEGVQYEIIAESLGVSTMTVWRRCKKLGLSRERKIEVKHGTFRGYYIHKCRCEPCIEAMREAHRRQVGSTRETAKRRRRPWTEAEDAAILSYEVPTTKLAEQLGRSFGAVRARRALLANPESKLPFSDEALTNMDATRRRRQAESVESATRSGYAWTQEEIDLAMDYSIPTHEIAKRLGRTVHAVRDARKRFGKKDGQQ